MCIQRDPIVTCAVIVKGSGYALIAHIIYNMCRRYQEEKKEQEHHLYTGITEIEQVTFSNFVHINCCTQFHYTASSCKLAIAL